MTDARAIANKANRTADIATANYNSHKLNCVLCMNESVFCPTFIAWEELMIKAINATAVAQLVGV